MNASRSVAATLALVSLVPATVLATGGDPADIRHASTLPPGMSLPIPKRREHTAFVVETNKKGQVVRVVAGSQCDDRTFNAFTYGNALQAFIRTPDGRAVAGSYRLDYEYEPRTMSVRRSVLLLRRGRVNPDAEGAVDSMAEVARHHAEREAREARQAATPLPDFRDITGHK